MKGTIKKEQFINELIKNKTLFIMLLPALFYFALFHYIPMTGLYMAFTRYHHVGGIFGSPFIGFENFRFLYVSGALFTITRNTVLYNLAFIITGNIFQIMVAIFLSEIPGKLFKKTTQSLMFLPYFISFVLLSVFVYNIFNYEFGLLNTIRSTFGLDPVNVYANTGIWKYILLGFNVWKGLGYGSVIYLAAIMNISTEIYESADIDGANVFQQIRHITLPMVKPTFIILLLLQVGQIMRGQFELFYQIVGTNGHLFEATDIIDTYVFRALVNNFDIGMGTAVGLYQSLFGFVFIIAVNYIVRRIEKDYALF